MRRIIKNLLICLRWLVKTLIIESIRLKQTAQKAFGVHQAKKEAEKPKPPPKVMEIEDLWADVDED